MHTFLRARVCALVCLCVYQVVSVPDKASRKNPRGETVQVRSMRESEGMTECALRATDSLLLRSYFALHFWGHRSAMCDRSRLGEAWRTWPIRGRHWNHVSVSVHCTLCSADSISVHTCSSRRSLPPSPSTPSFFTLLWVDVRKVLNLVHLSKSHRTVVALLFLLLSSFPLIPPPFPPPPSPSLSGGHPQYSLHLWRSLCGP